MIDSRPAAERNFNPRSPHGERPERLDAGLMEQLFQSTLPARGATESRTPYASGAQDFNPRSPHGERRHRHPCCGGAVPISIHAPRTGSDKNERENTPWEDISIHAPRTGSDKRRSAWRFSVRPFQSTLPARGATDGTRVLKSYRTFQSTLPARGATEPAHQESHGAAVISIHAPRTGSDPPAPASWTASPPFQSTLPARGATDELEELMRTIEPDFNPRSPHGERRAPPGFQRPFEVISIHAPRTGSDVPNFVLRAHPDISIHAPRTGSDMRA